MSETRARYRTTPASMRGPNAAIQRVEFWLPLPPAGCSPNNHDSHWSKRGTAVRDYRAECGMLLPCVHGAPAFQRATLSVSFYLAASPGRYHPRDTANGVSSLKAAIDSLVDRNWLPDDSAKYLSLGTVTLLSTAKEHGGRAGVAVTLEGVR